MAIHTSTKSMDDMTERYLALPSIVNGKFLLKEEYAYHKSVKEPITKGDVAFFSRDLCLLAPFFSAPEPATTWRDLAGQFSFQSGQRFRARLKEFFEGAPRILKVEKTKEHFRCQICGTHLTSVVTRGGRDIKLSVLFDFYGRHSPLNPAWRPGDAELAPLVGNCIWGSEEVQDPNGW